MRILILIILFCSSFVYSQNSQSPDLTNSKYRFSHISVADGLSPGTVNCIFKSNSGFLWIGTSSSLDRYDGYNIKNFNPNPKNSNALQSTEYRDIFEDPLGNIWVQTLAGINILNPVTEKFSSDQFEVLRELNIPEKAVKNIVKDSDGIFWFIHSGATITKYEPKSKKVTSLNLAVEDEELSNKEISFFAENSEGDFWIVYRNGLLQKLNGESLKIVYASKVLAKRFPNDLHDYQLIIDNQDNLWIHLYEDYGLFYYKKTNESLRNFNTKTASVRLSSNLINDFIKDGEGNIWVGTDHGGLDIINPENFSIKYLEKNPELKNSLSQNSITSFYRDRDGIIWIGTFKNGLDYYHPGLIKFPLEEKLLSDPESLPFNDVNVFAEDDEAHIFIGTNGGGLIVLDRKTGLYQQYTHDATDSKSISSNVIVSLLYDSKGALWIGTYLGGLNKMTPDGFQSYRHDPQIRNSIGGNNIWELFEDTRGNLWVGTLSAGLFKLDREEGLFYENNSKGRKWAAEIDYVSAIEEDADGNLWVGGLNGIVVINLETEKELYLKFNPYNPGSLSSNNIRSIHKDDLGNLWVGTDGGLDLYDKSDTSFYHYEEKDGLPDKKVIAITSDHQDNLWLTSSYGISQFQIKGAIVSEGKIPADFKNYNYQDGLQGNLFNENAIFTTSNGELLVGGIDGYNIFNPQKFEFNEQEPKVIFTEFSLFNSVISPYEKINGRAILDKPIHKTEGITLKHNENLFSVEFAALDFLQPSKNKYRYKLEGFDQQWLSVSSELRRVTYTNLDPGSYVLKVQASNNDGVWNLDGASLNLEILPPFYKTNLAYVIYCILLVGILYESRRRIILKQRRNFQIEQEKREAAYLHKMDLMKIRFFTNINHEFKTPIALILASIDKLKSYNLRETTNEQIGNIQKSAQKLLSLINQILDLGNIKSESQLFESSGNIIEFTEQIVSSFKDLAENRGVKIQFDTRVKKFQASFDKDKLDKILFNLLSNAIKFTPKGGSVTIEIDIRPVLGTQGKQHLFDLYITDTGIGIPKSDKAKIFERFFKVDHQQQMPEQGSGVGLALVKEYVELFKGKITVKSQLGQGTRFHLKIPVKAAGLSGVKDAVKLGKKELKKINNELLPNILIVEDDIDFLNHLIDSFKEFYNVFVASDGKEAWKKTLSVRPDIIVCDWQLPHMNGMALCEKLREDSRTKHIPFILITGNDQETVQLQALKTGVSDFVTKPFSFEGLHSRVQNLIKQQDLLKKTYSKKIELTPEENKVAFESEDEKLIRKIVQIIKNNIDDPNFSVELLAKEVGVSRSFLYNKTLVLFEKPPLNLITDIRLEEGKQLLISTQLTISEIAFKVGFNNPKYFTRNFKKKYKSLPSAYRTEVHTDH